jgi:hypothetical protein
VASTRVLLLVRSTPMSLITRFKKGSPANSPNSGSSGLSFFNRPAAKSASGKEQRVTAHSEPSTPSHSSLNPIGLSASVRSGINGLGGIFGYPSHDAKVSAARQKVEDAVTAEQLADKALTDARKKVKEAKEQAKILEREALEE